MIYYEMRREETDDVCDAFDNLNIDQKLVIQGDQVRAFIARGESFYILHVVGFIEGEKCFRAKRPAEKENKEWIRRSIRVLMNGLGDEAASQFPWFPVAVEDKGYGINAPCRFFSEFACAVEKNAREYLMDDEGNIPRSEEELEQRTQRQNELHEERMAKLSEEHNRWMEEHNRRMAEINMESARLESLIQVHPSAQLLVSQFIDALVLMPNSRRALVEQLRQDLMKIPGADLDQLIEFFGLEKYFEFADKPANANPHIVCPHCQTKGYVETMAKAKKMGVSGGKATGAILTGGLSLLFTGLSRKETVTKAWCHKCHTEWYL